jgi:hypothetical protein
MKTNREQMKRHVVAALLALCALVVLVGAIARSRPATPSAQSAARIAVMRLPGGGQQTVLLQPSHATTQTSPGGRSQLVSAVSPTGAPVLVAAPAGNTDR